jgi:hypothetical protein
MFEQLFELGSAAGDDSFKEAFQQDTLAVEGLLPNLFYFLVIICLMKLPLLLSSSASTPFVFLTLAFQE